MLYIVVDEQRPEQLLVVRVENEKQIEAWLKLFPSRKVICCSTSPLTDVLTNALFVNIGVLLDGG